MQKIFKLFKQSKIVKKFQILDFSSGQDFYYYKIKIDVIDSTILFIREYVSSTEHAYSYHWQDTKGQLIIRWVSKQLRKLNKSPEMSIKISQVN
ncbi:MAG: hypothetical protein HWN65_13400 [Candidatus Helarchaeota archaeon]|nr:hypothetical protein [Candidatus Helarchaeota archaeon]